MILNQDFVCKTEYNTSSFLNHKTTFFKKDNSTLLGRAEKGEPSLHFANV